MKPDWDRFLRRWTRSFTIARVESMKERTSPLPGAASGRKWRIRAPHIRPNPRRGATNATSIAVVKLARTPSDRRLAMRRVPSDTCVASARAKTSRSRRRTQCRCTRIALRKTLQGTTQAGCAQSTRWQRAGATPEEMDEVDPNQSQRRGTYEPPQVMVVYPNNSDERVAHRIADGRGPQRTESRERRLIRCSELRDHDSHDHREDRV